MSSRLSPLSWLPFVTNHPPHKILRSLSALKSLLASVLCVLDVSSTESVGGPLPEAGS